MIDKIELRLPRVTQFSPVVREFMAESRHFKNSSRTMGSGRYEWVTNLCPVGIDALLHYSLKRKENDSHEGESKLELLDTGTKGYSDIQRCSAVTLLPSPLILIWSSHSSSYWRPKWFP